MQVSKKASDQPILLWTSGQRVRKLFSEAAQQGEWAIFPHFLTVLLVVLTSDLYLRFQCIVQSYLQWLKDSDYDASCKFCGNPLQDENADQDCVRLICYRKYTGSSCLNSFFNIHSDIADVFHWECFNQFQQSLPANTAPSGRRCPVCSDSIFPPSNLVSPVCEALRTKLSQVNWGRNELGLPLVSQVRGVLMIFELIWNLPVF